MRYILSLIVFILLINTGQSQILLLVDSDSVTTVVGADITPPLPPTSYVAIGGTATDQFVSTWTDPTASDLDSIRFYEGSSNDTTAMTWIASIGAGTETYTRTGRTAGTTYWSAVKAIDDSGNVSYFSNIDSATTLPSSGFTPASLSPIFQLVYDADSVLVSGSKTVVSVTNNGYTFADADTTDPNGKIVQTDSSLYFGETSGIRRLQYADVGDSRFDLRLNDMSVDAWIYYAGDGKNGTIMADGENNAFWQFDLKLGDNVITPRITIANTAQDSVSRLNLNTGADSLSVGWHHLAFTLDRDGSRFMYIDSVLQTTNAEATGISWANTSAMVIDNSEATQIGSDNFGTLATVRYYSYVLSPAEVKQLFEYGVANGHR